jgi:hypothetical protein
MKTQKPKARRTKKPKMQLAPPFRVLWVRQSLATRFKVWIGSIVDSIRYFPGKYSPDLVPTESSNATSWMAYSNTTWTKSPE